MNKIQKAMHNKANNALGEVEYQIDLFLDNNCKSSFKMDKYLTQLDFKKKLVLIMKYSFNPYGRDCSDRKTSLSYSFLTILRKNDSLNSFQTTRVVISISPRTINMEETQKEKDFRRREAHNERIAQIESSSDIKKENSLDD